MAAVKYLEVNEWFPSTSEEWQAWSVIRATSGGKLDCIYNLIPVHWGGYQCMLARSVDKALASTWVRVHIKRGFSMSNLKKEIDKEANRIFIKYGIIGIVVGILIYFAYFR